MQSNLQKMVHIYCRTHFCRLLDESPHHKLQVQEEVADDVVVVADCEDGEGSVLV